MQFSTAFIAAAAAFLPLIEAHLFMDMPGSYRTGDNMPPILPDGSNFPCAVPDFANVAGTPLTLNPGQQAEIKLFGTAVHSGGSCQISITYDSPPTKASVWKVMKSFEGGCPVRHEGNLEGIAGDPSKHALAPLGYTVTQGLHKGPATIAWTWFNKTGNREMYMRCMKVNIGGSNTSDAEWKKLPKIFIANTGNGCSTVPGDLIFPDPGPVKVGSGNVKPVGNCQAAGAPAPGPANPGPPPAPVNPPKQVPVAAPPPATGGGAGGACKGTEVSCDGTRWFSCVHGKMTDRGLLAPGTGCSAVMSNAKRSKAKRSIRFSEDHMAKRAL